ncbi:hypothetical protein ONE56_17070 [Vibrio mytili]|uniref:hypothetical protein n=1 Tax=Vibrio mytili TaxID=50718 RepID=UPI003C6F9584
MTVSTALITPLLSFIPLSLPNDSTQIFTDIHVSGYAENNEIYPLIKGHPGHYSTSEHAYTLNQAEIGVRMGEFSVSLFSRYEWYLNYSPDAMLLYGESVNGQDMQAGKAYDIDLNVEHLVSNGLKLGWSHDWSESFSSYVSVSYLEAREVMSGRLNGHVQHLQGQNYDGLLNLNYVYSEDVLLDRELSGDQKSHFGYSSDVGLNWMPTDKWFVSLWAQDVLNAIKWRGVPRTRATADTATAETDEDGFVSIRPTVTGREDDTDYTQHLPTKYHSRVSYIAHQNAFGLKSLYVDDLWLVDAEWFARWSNQLFTQVTYNIQSDAIGLKAQWYGLTLGVASDSIDYQDAEHLNVNIGFGFNI